ncbi:MAG: SGNH/GDSL hydrolase family protein [Dehalococcoidia bacterium]|jgi:lysophospholipase L1-like esterase
MGRDRVQLAVAVAIAAALFLTPKDIAYDGASIAFVGDSLTLGGDASSPSKDFASLVTDYLDKRGVQETKHIFASGDPDPDLHFALAAQAMKDDRVFVILELGVHAVTAPQLSPDEFRQIYGSVLDCVAGDDTIIVAGTVPWLGWAPSDPLYARAEQFSGIIAEEAAKRQIAVADLWSAMKLRPELLSTPQDYTFLGSHQGDNFHPGDAGHAVIAHVYDQALAGELVSPPHRSYERKCH